MAYRQLSREAEEDGNLWCKEVGTGRERELCLYWGGMGVGEARWGGKPLRLAQLGLEADASRARRLRKTSKGWTWWNLPSGASLKLWHWAQRQEVLSTAWVARIPPFPWSPWLTEGRALPQLTLSRQTPSPLREHLSRPPFLTQRGETRGTHLLQSSNSEKPKRSAASRSLSHRSSRELPALYG